MPLNIRELVVVLVLATVVFVVAKPVLLRFASERDFARRRNVWYFLTIVAFLSPSFWIYVAFAIPTLLIAARRDSHPTCLYLLLLHIIPPVSTEIPMPGLSRLFNVDNYLLLSFCVLTPSAVRLLRKSDRERPHDWRVVDVALLGYVALSAVLYVHPQDTVTGAVYPSSFTDDVRRGFVGLFGTVVPYFVISRVSRDRRALTDNLATFCLGGCIMALIGVFETARHWLVYADLPSQWGFVYRATFYLSRSGSVRAIASTGQPLGLGLNLAVAFGFWLYVQRHVRTIPRRLAVGALLLIGLLASYSRGPWLGAAVIYFAYALLSPSAVTRKFKALAAAVGCVCVVVLTPFGDRLLDLIPIFGNGSTDPSLLYRQRILHRALQIIGQSPWLGDQYAMLKMQDLRQGEGIIDIVNTYVEILLANGIIGLSLFATFSLTIMYRCWTRTRAVRQADADLGAMGATLVASMVGILVMFASSSFAGPEYYMLAACTAGCAYIAQSARHAETRSAVDRVVAPRLGRAGPV